MACPLLLWFDKELGKQKGSALDTIIPERYRAFGNLCHYGIQTRLGCVLEEPSPEDYIEAEPMMLELETCVAGAVKHINDTYGVREWKAEQAWDNEFLQGHTDLVCGNILVDIKTTGKMPARKQIATDHYWQLLAYHWMTGATDMRILYVNNAGKWVTLSNSIDLSKPGVQRDVETMKRQLENPVYWANYGSVCTKCSRVSECRSENVPFVADPTEIVPVHARGGALDDLGI